MSRRHAPTRPWAPFPVQDWSRYARDSRSWRASRRTPVAGMVGVVVLVVLAALVLVAVDTPARPAGPATTNPYLPPDGTTEPVRHRRGDEPAVVRSVGTALLAAPLATQSVPLPVGNALIGALRQQLTTTVWRRTLVHDDHDAAELWSTGTELRLLVVESPVVLGYVGGVLVLPADAAPGRSWTSEGAVVSQVPGLVGASWRSSFVASAADDPACLTVTGRIEVTGSPDTTTDVSQTWCRGRGPVSSSLTRTGIVEQWDRTEPVRTAVATADRPAPPSGDPRRDPRTWQGSALPVVTRAPDGAAHPVAGAPGSTLRATAAGRPVVTAGADVLVLDPVDDALVVRHRLHPGGNLLATEAFGDVVVVGTDRRQVVAYSSVSGAELWRHRLPDVSYDRLVRLDQGAVLLASVNGEVRAVDLASGALRWQRPALFTAGFPATTSHGRVVIADPRGDLVAVDAATGAQVWRTAVDGNVEHLGTGFSGGTVLAFTDRGLLGLSVTDGSPVLRRRAGNWTDRAVLPATLVLAQPDVVVGIRADGSEAWRRPLACELVSATADLLACWQPTAVVLLDEYGNEVARHEVPDHVAGQLAVTVPAAGLWWRANRAGETAATWEVHRWQAS